MSHFGSTGRDRGRRRTPAGWPLPELRSWARLVRAPAARAVAGDLVAGAAVAAGRLRSPAAWPVPGLRNWAHLMHAPAALTVPIDLAAETPVAAGRPRSPAARSLSELRTWARLVRAPAARTVPGDLVTGTAVTAGQLRSPAAWPVPGLRNWVHLMHAPAALTDPGDLAAGAAMAASRRRRTATWPLPELRTWTRFVHAPPALTIPVNLAAAAAIAAGRPRTPAAQPLPQLRTWARLVRAPAALTVPGDLIAGAAMARRPLGRSLPSTTAGSVALYWAGMALNDYVDRDTDARERPARPVPAGEVAPFQALGLASALTLAGLVLSRERATTGLLAGAVWAYDLVAKDTAAGPVAMAAARALNVLAGAGGRPEALPAALTVAAHTAGVTRLSRYETTGAPPAALYEALAVTGVTAAVPVLLAVRGSGGRLRSAVPAALLYLLWCGRAQLAALRAPSEVNVRAAVAAGIHGLLPLQAALTAAAGSPGAALTVIAGHPLAVRLGRKVSPT